MDLVHIYSCTIHLHTYTHTPWQTLNLSNDGTHTPHTHMYLACKICSAEPVHCTCTCIYSIELVICMYERPLILFSISVLWLGFCTCSALSIHSWCWQLLSCMGAPFWLVLCTYSTMQHETHNNFHWEGMQQCFSFILVAVFASPAQLLFWTLAVNSISCFWQLDVDVVLLYCQPNYFAAILFPQYTRLALCTSAPCIDWPSYQGRVALVKILIVGYRATCR